MSSLNELIINIKTNLKMKRKLLSFGLLAAGLLTAGNVSAGTTTYDFTGVNTVTVSSDNSYTFSVLNGTTSSDITVYQCTMSGFERFYVNAASGTTNKSNKWWYRNSNWGIYTSGAYLSINNLLEGDKVTITVYNGSFTLKSQNVEGVDSGTVVTQASKNQTTTTGTTMTMSEAGHLDLYGSWMGLRSIVIESSAETVTTPSIEATAANGGTRTVTITPGVSSESANTVKTYYTTDGTTPSAESTEYTGTFDITETKTIQAISISSSGLASSVNSTSIEAGTTLALAAITSTITGMSSETAPAYPVYTFTNDNSSVIGAPTSTLSATFTPDGGSATEVTLTDGAYTFTEKGSLEVTASADGYESVTTTITVANAYEINRTYDFASLDADEMVNTYGWTSGNSYYTADSESTLPYVTVQNIAQWRWYSGKGIYNGGSGYRTVTLQEAAEGEIALFYYNGATTPEKAVEYNSGIAWAMTRYKTLEKINVYSVYEEATSVAKSITAGGYATFASKYAVSIPEGITAYYITEKNIDLETNKINMTKITATTIPANTGIVIEGKESDYEFPVVESSDTELTGNLMQVADGTNTCGDNCYGMHKTKGIFVKLKSDAVLSEGKAYLKVPESTGAKLGNELIIANDNVNAINEVNAAAKSGKIYNLQGIEVKSASNGLYIVNGKKVIK